MISMGRIKYKRPRSKRVKPPKAVPPPKPHRPKRGDLKHIYKDLISSDIDQRITVLAKAMAWYDKVQAYLAYKNEGKFTTKQLRAKNKAEKYRSEGIKSTHSHIKEDRFLNAILHYETMVNSYKSPLIKYYLRKYKKTEKKLIERKERMEDKHERFLSQLQEALQPVNTKGDKIKLQVDKLSSPYRISIEGNVTLDRKLVGELRKLAY